MEIITYLPLYRQSLRSHFLTFRLDSGQTLRRRWFEPCEWIQCFPRKTCKCFAGASRGHVSTGIWYASKKKGGCYSRWRGEGSFLTIQFTLKYGIGSSMMEIMWVIARFAKATWSLLSSKEPTYNPGRICWELFQM